MRKAPLRSSGMSPERTRRLLVEVKAWCKTHGVLQKDLAEMIGVSPQRLNDIMTRRRECEPTGEQVLQLLELLKTRPKQK
jgi:transcriptional regulator with XRE-family HTH domain